MNRFALLMCAVAMAGCGQRQDNQTDTADMLENAAQQSDPGSAAVLRNAADVADDKNINENVSDPDSFAQNALEMAGEAQGNQQGE